MKKQDFAMTALMSTLFITGCSTSPVKPAYVSPTQYQSLTCPQLQSEYKRLQQYVDSGVEAPKRTGMGVGLGLGAGWGSRSGWGLIPNISVNMGQSGNTKKTELARILGQQDAVFQAAKFKNCPILVTKKLNK